MSEGFMQGATKERMSVMGEYMFGGRTAKPKGSSIELGVAIR